MSLRARVIAGTASLLGFICGCLSSQPTLSIHFENPSVSALMASLATRMRAPGNASFSVREPM